MNLATMTADQQDFTATFQLTAAAAAAAAGGSSSSDGSSVTISAVILWFDVEFSERFCKDHPVTLSTSPTAEVTHWAHAVLPLQTPIKFATSAAAAAVGGSSVLPSSVECRLSMARSRSKHRSLDISLEVGSQARVYTMEVTGTD
jgi:protein arginine N-methyltransferase 3